MWQPIEIVPVPKDGTYVIVSGPMPWLPDLVVWRNDRKQRTMEWGIEYAVPAGWFSVHGVRSRYDDGHGGLRNAKFWMPMPKPPTDDQH